MESRFADVLVRTIEVNMLSSAVEWIFFISEKKSIRPIYIMMINIA